MLGDEILEALFPEVGFDALPGDGVQIDGARQPDTLILISGHRQSYETHKDLLSALGGQVTFVGEPIATAATLDSAILTMFYGQAVGFLHGLLLCEKEGYATEEFTELAVGDMPPVVAGALRRLSRIIREDRFADAEATVNTIAASLRSIVREHREAGIKDEFPALMLRLYEMASAAGAGQEDSAALIKVLRAAS